MGELTILEKTFGAFFGENLQAFEGEIQTLQLSSQRLMEGAQEGKPLEMARGFLDTLTGTAMIGSHVAELGTLFLNLTSGREEEGLLEQGIRVFGNLSAMARLEGELAVTGLGSCGLYAYDLFRGADVSARVDEVNELYDHLIGKFRARNPRRLAEDHNLVEHADYESQGEYWTAALAFLKSAGKDLPYRQIKTHGDFLDYLKEGGIAYPKRIEAIETGVTLVENRKALETLGRNRPIVAVIANTADHNNAFVAKNSPLLDPLVSSNKFDVVYFEVGSDEEAVEALKKVREASGRKISLAIFSGHGNSDEIRLGPGTGGDKKLGRRDLSDEEGVVRVLDEAIAEDGQILLDACSTGEVMEEGNFGEAMAEALPGREVFGTRVKNTLTGLEFQGLRLSHVDWKHGEEYILKVDRPVADTDSNPSLLAQVLANTGRLWEF